MRIITLGLSCNNACAFCAQGDLRAARPSFEAAEIERAIAAITEVETVAFLGGEPTLADLARRV